MSKAMVFLGVFLLTLGIQASPLEDLRKATSLWFEAVEANDKDDKLLTLLSNQDFREQQNLLSDLKGVLLRSNDVYQKCQVFFVFEKFPKYMPAQWALPYLKLENPKIYMMITELPLIARFPAQAALIEAGPRVVPDILKTMAESEDKEIRAYCLHMIFRIYCPGSFDDTAMEITKLVVNKYLSKLTDAKQRETLQQELAAFCLAHEEQTAAEERLP